MSLYNFIASLYSNDIYIQIWEDRLKVTNLDTHLVFDDIPIVALRINKKGDQVIEAIGRSARSIPNKGDMSLSNPFSHPRVLVNDFQLASLVVTHAIRDVHGNSWFLPKPRVVIHPMEKLEGGLTFIEQRVFRELCFNASAREISVYTGTEPTVANLNYQWLKHVSS